MKTVNTIWYKKGSRRPGQLWFEVVRCTLDKGLNGPYTQPLVFIPSVLFYRCRWSHLFTYYIWEQTHKLSFDLPLDQLHFKSFHCILTLMPETQSDPQSCNFITPTHHIQLVTNFCVFYPQGAIQIHPFLHPSAITLWLTY